MARPACVVDGKSPVPVALRGCEEKEQVMADLIDRKEAIRAWCKLTCGCEPEECGMTIERDGAEECEFVEFLWHRPEYDCTKCFLWERDEDE